MNRDKVSEATLYAMRMDAALAEWRRCRETEVEVLRDVMCDVCLARKAEVHRRGLKGICRDCARINVSHCGNTRPSVPLGDFLYEMWDGGKRHDHGDTEANDRLAEPRKQTEERKTK